MNNLVEYTDHYISRLQPILEKFGNGPERVKALVHRWQQELNTLRAYARTHQNVSVAFVGGTGAGKSTLINALIDADVLPTHSFQTCTSAAMVLRHAPRKTWRATLTFLPESAWEKEKQSFMDEARESMVSGQSSFVYQDFLYKAWALYRPRRGQPPMPFALTNLLTLLEEPLPESVRQLLSTEPLQIKAKTPEVMKQQLRKYLTAESPLWPLVQEVQIEGPIELLSEGLQVVDLPGLNDANPVREAIARKYLKQAEFVCLTFNTARGLTREVVDLMKDQQFINQMVMDGKVSALAFVATRADDYQPEMERRHLDLEASMSPRALHVARENQIQQLILRQLSELTLWYSNRYKVSPEARQIVQLIADTLTQSPIFITSALNYLLLQQEQKPTLEAFETAEHTGFPQLQAYIQNIASTQGVQARKKVLRVRFQQMNAEIKRLVHLLKQSEQPFETLEAQQAHRLACQKLEVTLGRVSERQGRLQLDFQRKLLYTFNDLQAQVDQLEDKWGGLNWQYLVKAVENQGQYTSAATGVHVDLIKDVTDFMTQIFAVEWYAFFQVNMPEHLDTTERQLRDVLGEFALPKTTKQKWIQDLQQFTQFARIQLNTLREHMQSYIEQSLTDLLLPVFETAAKHKGKGRKQQMIETLSQSLKTTLPETARQLETETGQQLENCLQRIEAQVIALGEDLRTPLSPREA